MPDAATNLPPDRVCSKEGGDWNMESGLLDSAFLLSLVLQSDKKVFALI